MRLRLPWRPLAVVCRDLKLLSQKFKKDVTHEGSDRGNFKIGHRNHISNSPNYALPLRDPRALKFSHQEIGIKQEDDKRHFDYRSPDVFLHGKYRLPGIIHRIITATNSPAAMCSRSGGTTT